MVGLYPFCPAGNFFGIGIAAHEGDAGDHGSVAGEKAVEQVFTHHLADILRQLRAVATRAVAGAVREIEGECYLARNLLKNDIKGSDLHQHFGAFVFSA